MLICSLDCKKVMSDASESNLVSLDLKLKKFSNPEKAKQMQRFFKTGKGEYERKTLYALNS
ncbi:MAG: hypothetical protein CVU81_02275 [Euryarchaeota archaeon HGW-Euryarchaeota-1]|nr:MAG: hypothetical protein CVU81_02275 [Euryarchaeota archaeon HGW-Euryarchaeota-1]